ncbi:MAG: CBS and ACT domain-containing protein [Desulfobulbaceae bacterium]|nr:CBS and ACT domain-containing protein [Desulfobulbaceae bacterium]
MLIKDWMAKDVLTVNEDASLMRVTRIMQENNIRRLPVVANGMLVGIITDRDVKDASPSKAASMNIHELHRMMSEMKVTEVMTPTPMTLSGNDSLEKAALIMLECKISGLPVADQEGRLTGVISETDVLRAFIHSTGIKDGAVQFVLHLNDAPGSVTKLIETLRQHKTQVISILTSYEDAPAGKKKVAVRVLPENQATADTLPQILADNFDVVYHAKDELKNLPRKGGR